MILALILARCFRGVMGVVSVWRLHGVGGLMLASVCDLRCGLMRLKFRRVVWIVLCVVCRGLRIDFYAYC